MDKEEKEIEYLNSHINRLWTSMIVLVGGLSGLALSLSRSDTVLKIVVKGSLGLLGFCFLIVTISSLINVDYKINKKIK